LGPVAVPFLSAYLASQLDHADLPVEARWDAAAIHWPFMAPWLYVRFSDFRASDALTAEGIGIRVPLRDLVRGQPSVAGVVLYAPTVVLKQGEGDGFSFGDGAAQSGSESPLAAVASGTMIAVLDGTIPLELRRSPAALRRVLDRCLDATDGLLTSAERLPGELRDTRFAMEAAAIVAIARKLGRELRRRDPLAERVVLTKAQYAACCARGVGRVLFRRAVRRLRPAAADASRIGAPAGSRDHS